VIKKTDRKWRLAGALGGAVALLGVAGCDLSVENPGPVADGILDGSAAHQAVVNGVARTISISLNTIALQTGAVTREVMASGNTTIGIEAGNGNITTQSNAGLFDAVQNARWMGNDAVRRLTEAKASNELLAQANLWAGFANRWGDILCDAVIDGGPKQAYTVMLDKAVAQFTAAYTLSAVTATKNAALAGRASVLADLNKLTEAVVDSKQIADGFTFQAKYSAEENSQRNEIYFYSANAPYRVHSVWDTPYEQYYLDTADPRTPWIKVPAFPFGEIQRPLAGVSTSVPWYPQQKFKTYNDPMNLVSGREMRLIEAEERLIANDLAGAMALINKVRTTAKPGVSNPPATVTAYPVTNINDAWTALRKEKGIELWLEGRRMADLRRWKSANRPGVLQPLEDPANPKTYIVAPQSLCAPVSQNEVDANPNF
jgi:starch-binding outer membrane protein, SusD/RagB family